ncbi:MAG: hypothetical protein EYC62_02945 [Alphaproteobacteria bacterium]|nr:MAG: hypothetical protein EYC62_02945 [Alphaproteobacteria bacterium]
MRCRTKKVYPAVVMLDNAPGMPVLSDKIYKSPVLLKAWIAHCVNGAPIDTGVSHDRAMQAAQKLRTLTATR